MASFPSISSPTLSLEHVLDNVLCLEEDSFVRGALTHAWIFTINDLMLIKPYEDLSADYYHPTLGDDGEQRDLLMTIPSMVIRNIVYLQEWYRQQASIDQSIWLMLSAESFAT